MNEATPKPRIGLALSGGGFRAAFFHVGVLARLAELGLLRKVEVISTVSGGSIVGALYYVLLKRRLERDGRLGDPDYCELVHDVEARLLEAVGKNIRARVPANLLKNLYMALPSYSRSDRIGDLYDRYLYKEAWGAGRDRKWWGAQKQIELRELLIPSGPALLVNATTLNSGHNWRFETSRMGEPLPEEDESAEVVRDVDKNMRLTQGFFEPDWGQPAVPERQRDFPLGIAVAASACVPGVFHPLAISGMYRGIRVQLVDGGVQDNQGVQGLFDRSCTHLIVSDASRQLDDAERPSTRIPGVVRRSLSISGDRIRDEQLVHAYASGGRSCCAVMHLRKGLDGKAVPPGGSLERAGEERAGAFSCREFGVHPEVQEALARIRTDLDLFSDYEAFSLALDGYLMTGYEIEHREKLEELTKDAAPPKTGVRWRFLRIAALIGEAPSGSYRRHLSAASHRFFRPVFLLPEWSAVLLVLVTAALLAGVALILAELVGDSVTDMFDDDWPSAIVVPAIGAVALVAGLYAAANIRSILVRVPIDLLAGMVLPIVLAVPAFLWAHLQLLPRRVSLLLGRAPDNTA